MPLSDHEQRMLEQMEKALYAEDPKFATSLRSGAGPRASRARAGLGALAFLLGVMLLMVGAVTSMIAVGVLGFVVMLMGTVLSIAGLRAKPADAEAAAKPSTSKRARGFGSRLEDRWQRRRDQM